jgi:hypothetical protein
MKLQCDWCDAVDVHNMIRGINLCHSCCQILGALSASTLAARKLFMPVTDQKDQKKGEQQKN